MKRTWNGLLTALLFLLLFGATAAAQERAREAIARGNEHYARGEYKLAIAEYERVSRAEDEAYAQALYNVGVCRFELWQTEEAARSYRQAIEARGRSYPKASYALGVALEELRREPEARAAYEQAAKKGYALAHYKLGMLAARAGDGESAAGHFREAIKLSKDKFPAGHNDLGVVLARAGRLSEAEREFEAAVRQSDAPFEEAAQNLKLCRKLLAGQSKDGAAALKVANAADGFTR
ncbi:MAG: tetratricopeptide repeat protein [Acidobacteria bacterium]|nr:tetratricopeptide repeat protein [Acidobacteriota bacterium]